ncbi:MAG: SpoIID/LytB domain-containing protein [Ruminococcus sp.]|nr:SpoIID/LytB domain-containing protein [Ruminococcus sp.]
MKEMLKTALLWIVIICALPVLLCAKDVTASGDKPVMGSSGNGENGGQSGETPLFTLVGELTLLIYGFEGDYVTRMDIEEYVYRSVSAQIPGDTELEALKAQAAAARTYAVRRLLSGTEQVSEGVFAHMTCDPEKYQVPLTDREIALIYGDADGLSGNIPPKVRQAVSETAGEIIVYGGSPIIAAFHTANGGVTEWGGYVWDELTDENAPYLSPAESRYDRESGYYGVKYTFTDREIRARLSAVLDGVTEEYSGVTLLSVTEAGNVRSLSICGKEISGGLFAKIFSLPSRAFTADYDSGSGVTVFTVNGSGHMAGMSIYGADRMAAEGADYREIILHYYKGVRVGKLAED